jgi:hypothetical protein
VARLIGKPILSRFISREKRSEITDSCFEALLELEERFCDIFCDIPSLVGIGGHLEIVGIKK